MNYIFDIQIESIYKIKFWF